MLEFYFSNYRSSHFFIRVLKSPRKTEIRQVCTELRDFVNSAHDYFHVLAIPLDEYENILPVPSDFASFIGRVASESKATAYHVTFTYKNVRTPRQADAALLKSLPCFLRSAVSNNWTRRKYRNSIQIFCFLDQGKSNYSISNSNRENNAWHHHCILLVTEAIGNRINNRLKIKPFHGDTRSSEKQLSAIISPKTLGSKIIKTCHVRLLEGDEDLERTATYAAKAITREIANNNEYSFRIFNTENNHFFEN